MKSILLTVAIVCAVIFLIASLMAGGPVFYSRRSTSAFWMAVQTLSAVLGILAFVIQIVQWGRGPRA